MTEDPSPLTLVAELWYETAPDLAGPDLLAALREVSAAAEPQGESITVPHETADRHPEAPPLLSVVMAGSPLGADGKTLPSVSQTWSWAGAEDALARCRESVLVTEMFAASGSRRERVEGLAGVVDVLTRQTHPVLISWPHSQRVVDPADLVAGELDGIVNVRLFEIANENGTLVVDTLGLHVFGLPDLQCHFRDRSPGEIAALLFSVASYLFDAGDVIADGHTISGPRGDERLVCRHEPALLQPARTVLDVDLGDPYAAGERGR